MFKLSELLHAGNSSFVSMYSSYFNHPPSSVDSGSSWLVSATPDCPGSSPTSGFTPSSSFFNDRSATMATDWLSPFHHHPYHTHNSPAGDVTASSVRPSFYIASEGGTNRGLTSDPPSSPPSTTTVSYRRHHHAQQQTVCHVPSVTAASLMMIAGEQQTSPVNDEEHLPSKSDAIQTQKLTKTVTTSSGYESHSSNRRVLAADVDYEGQQCIRQQPDYNPDIKSPPRLKRSDSFTATDESTARDRNVTTAATSSDSERFHLQSSGSSFPSTSGTAAASSVFNDLYQRFSPFVSGSHATSSSPIGCRSSGVTSSRSTGKGLAIVPPSPQKEQPTYQPHQTHQHPTAVAYRYQQQTQPYHQPPFNGTSHHCGRSSQFASSSPGYTVPTDAYASGMGSSVLAARSSSSDDGGALMSAALFHSAAAAAAAAAGMLKHHHHHHQERQQMSPSSYAIGGTVRLRTKSHSSSGSLPFLYLLEFIFKRNISTLPVYALHEFTLLKRQHHT